MACSWRSTRRRRCAKRHRVRAMLEPLVEAATALQSATGSDSPSLLGAAPGGIRCAAAAPCSWWRSDRLAVAIGAAGDSAARGRLATARLGRQCRADGAESRDVRVPVAVAAHRRPGRARRHYRPVAYALLPIVHDHRRILGRSVVGRGGHRPRDDAGAAAASSPATAGATIDVAIRVAAVTAGTATIAGRRRRRAGRVHFPRPSMVDQRSSSQAIGRALAPPTVT